jgi:CheY-like chemotaxis protein
MSGVELYRRIEKIGQPLARRVVFITGDIMGIDTSNFISQVKVPYISKPFDSQQLKREINRLLDNREQTN